MSYEGLRRVAVLLMVVSLTAFAFTALAPVASRVVSASSTAPLLYDDFAHDTGLNASLWQVNGPVGSIFGPEDAGVNLVTLVPAFSSNGMEVAQVNDSQEVGTIQSVENFTPPFTATAEVEGTVSNGHTFGFAISSANASSGVLIYGNLNPTNCSHLGDCGDPSVCGTSANSAIPPNQCYYGIDAKVGQGAGSWPHVAKLYLTPSVNVTYTLQIYVDASGSAQFSVSQGGQVLGQASAQVGTGPFYVILEQAEGSPVAHPGPNQAYWMSVTLASGSTISETSTTSISTTTSTSPSPSPGGIGLYVWIIVAIIIVFLLLVILLWYRRRSLTVSVLDSKTLLPIFGAAVSASGPQKLSGTTEKNGKAVFSSPEKGDYSIQAVARGYDTSVPVSVSVKGRAEYTVRLAPSLGGTPATGGVSPPGGLQATHIVPGPGSQTPQAAAPSAPAAGQVPVRAAEAVPPQPVEQELPELEGWGGGRIREIIRTFQEKRAISPETALTAKELGLSRLFVRIMERRKGRTMIFVEVNGKYYLNQDALKQTKQ